MDNGFHPKSNVDRLYLSRRKGGRGLIGAQDFVEAAILWLRNYVRNSKESLLIAARTIEDDKNRETPSEHKIGKRMKGNTVDTKTITWTIYQASNG